MNDKNAVREKLKIKRRYFGNYIREVADAVIYDNFFNAYSGFDSFFIYNSFGTEADTKKIISALLAEGKKVYLPRVEGGEMVAVPFGEMQTGAFGIEEPKGQAYNGEIEVTVIPLLAVNNRGYRVGYGKGFYDKYLKDKHTKKVGLGYFFQIEDFKEDTHDIPLDEFLCEKGIFYYADK